MRIIALLIGMILVSVSVVAAVNTPGQVDPLAKPEFQDGLPYTGIIKNKTKYEVSIPSQNSDGTLSIPPHGWIEYTIWTHNVDVTAYYNGTPFYCLKIAAHPKAFPFMCKKYDFMAEIVKAEPVPKRKPVKQKRRIKRKPKGDGGVAGLG